MGPHLMRRPPKYVHGYIDRHGRARFYFRRAGHKKVPLPGLPWSPEFMTAYEAAVSEAPRIEIGAARIKPGTVAAAVAGYFGSAAFSNHAESTRRTRRQIVERLLAAKTPGAALNFLGALRALMRHAVLAGLRADDPTTGVRAPKFKSTGFYTWTEADIAAFETRHPIGSRARLALAL